MGITDGSLDNGHVQCTLQARPALGVLGPGTHEVLRSHRPSESPKNGGNCVNILSYSVDVCFHIVAADRFPASMH